MLVVENASFMREALDPGAMERWSDDVIARIRTLIPLILSLILRKIVVLSLSLMQDS